MADAEGNMHESASLPYPTAVSENFDDDVEVFMVIMERLTVPC